MNAEIEALFAKHQLRMTTPRKHLVEILKDADAPLSPVEITKQRPAMDKVSVYRTIELFKKIGLVSGVAYGWKQRYELAAPFRPHHHHLLCSECGNVEEIQSTKLEELITLLANEYDFEIKEHTFEVSGLCRVCRVKDILREEDESRSVSRFS